MIITLTDSITSLNVGKVVGEKGEQGEQGEQGTAGKDGIGIASITINEKGELIVALSDGSAAKNLGVIVGEDGKDGATWLTGAGVPNAEQGNVGDLYLDTSTCDIYQKGEGGWGASILNVKGEAGEKGEQGEKGPQGEKGEQGERGPQGEKGEQGEAGKDGKDGATWLTGTTAPNAEQGNVGDLYLDTSTCDIYQKDEGGWGAPILNAKGETGEKGEQGEQGPQGEKGTDGRGIEDIKIIDGRLIIYYSDQTHVDIGNVSDVSVTPESSEFLFSLCADGTYAIEECYIQDETKITIPAMWNGKPVTRIQSGVFQGNSILESIVLPNCLQYIGESAFAGCDALCIVEIDSDSELKEIAAHAFQGCDSLKSIYLPGQLCYIGEYAFEGTSLISAVFAKPTNWNLFGTWNGYIADLSPTNALNAGKALSTTYESHGSSNFYQTAWIRSDAYSNGTIPTTYEKEL